MRHQNVFRALLCGVLLSILPSAKAQITLVRLNEVLASNESYTNSDGSITDLLELFNAGTSPVDLGGSRLVDPTNGLAYVFPVGSQIPGRGFYRMTCGNGSNATSVPFSIRASGGVLQLYTPALTLIDQVEFGLQATDFSFGRVTDGTGPWVLCVPTFPGANSSAQLGQRSMLRINEWRVKGSGSDWIELFNPTNRPVDIGDMYLSDTLSGSPGPRKFRIAANSFIGTGPMGGFQRFSDGGNSVPKYPADQWANFGLGDGERVVLTDTNPVLTTIIDDTGPYGNQTDDVSQGRLPDGSTNFVLFPKINDYDTASPGNPNFLIFTNLYVNELLAHTDPPLEDAIEFLNKGVAPVNISGWWLSNARNNRRKYRVPAMSPIAAGGFRVLYEGVGTNVGFNSSSPNAVQPFTFNSARGDQAVLAQVDANGNLTGYIAYEEFEPSANGVSFGHYDTSVPNDYKFVAMSQISFGVNDPNTVQEFRQGAGQTNPYPRVGPLVINEIHYWPSNTTYLNTNGFPTNAANPLDEFIELRNITSQTVPLYDPLFPTNQWKFASGVDFTFPVTNLAPNQFCLIVAFNPHANPSTLAAFRARFAVPGDVPIFGPWIGSLNNDGEALELYRPDPPQAPGRPDEGLVPYIRVDKVNYEIGAPWPPSVATNGPAGLASTGRSLQRRNSLLFGNDPINWAADVTTAGRSSSSALADTDGDGMPDQWEMDHNLNKNNPADADDDPDRDGANNLGEYVSGSNPTNGASVLRFSEIVPFQITNRLVRFRAFSNATYTVQYRNALRVGSDWNRVANVAAGPERLVEITDTNAWEKNDRFYRVIAPATQ